MLTLDDLDHAQPGLWQHACDDALTTARHCEHLASVARDEVNRTLAGAWTSPTGDSARARFARHAESYDSAALSMRDLAKVYDRLATAMADAQRALHAALDFARDHRLNVAQDGSVHRGPGPVDPARAAALDEQIQHAEGLVITALRNATEADTAATDELRTLARLSEIDSAATVREALDHDGNSALGVALRLQGAQRDGNGPHPINVPPELIEAARRASAETGVSTDLLLSVLWQEQQWYQALEPGLDGPLTAIGRRADWAAAESLKPDKSLGITHIKPATARAAIDRDPAAFPGLAALSDAQLAKYIEENPAEDVRLSAHHLKRLRQDHHGAITDKQLFLLYAADTPQVRDSNSRYGDDGSHRGAAIKDRSDSWDSLQQSLRDADAWNNLPEAERRKALANLASRTPNDTELALNPVYAAPGVSTTAHGTAPLPPDRPRPPTLPSPTLPSPTAPSPAAPPPPAPPPPAAAPPAPSPGPAPTPPAG
ncbi:hypothetical protein ACFV4P_11580 [Kitasatospora sp. NPDC059795]|uniref:hypothetical protein n=1 Tax=Kitasatospora sp. NPDC059795 TaxID=3346949 RepID=UPI003661EF9D